MRTTPALAAQFPASDVCFRWRWKGNRSFNQNVQMHTDGARGGRPEGAPPATNFPEETRAMVSPVKEFSSAARAAQDTAQSTIAELRDKVATLAKEVAECRRAAHARGTARRRGCGGGEHVGASSYDTPSAGRGHDGCRGRRGCAGIVGRPAFRQPRLHRRRVAIPGRRTLPAPICTTSPTTFRVPSRGPRSRVPQASRRPSSVS